MTDTWQSPFSVLRQKWSVVPAGASDRASTLDLLRLPDQELVERWSAAVRAATEGEAFNIRGWYHLLYKGILRGKQVLDVGCGIGIDGITFAQHGACVTFVDIVESNVELVRRLCRLLGVTNVDFCYMHDLESIKPLPRDYDVLWCQGSLINAPFWVIREEVQALLQHLPVGSRWVELAYPKHRWEREGQLPFDRWGERTDGGAPWMEWYDLSKLQKALEPAEFDVVLYFEFHDSDFNWFDLMRRT